MNKARLRILATPLLIVLIWQIVAALNIFSPYLLPSPITVLQSFIHLCGNGVLLQNITASLARVFAGFFISCFMAILLAALLNRSLVLEQLCSVPLSFMRMVPPLAMTPLLILWAGIGNTTQLIIIILACFFPIFLNARDGLRRVTVEQKELAKSLMLSRKRYACYILLPAATPSIVTGARLAFGYSWRALIGAELIAASSGLGYMIIDAQELQRTDEVMVGIIVIGLIGWILDTLFYRVVVKTLGRRFPEVKN